MLYLELDLVVQHQNKEIDQHAFDRFHFDFIVYLSLSLHGSFK